ncbi:MAG: ABC transporter permease [Lachnospiraceae bacterium]|nr:ABC transporter permease [Lachnospiraceae bacterium]
MLTKKLFRTIGRYKAQFISMIIMVGLGVGIFLGFNIEWKTLEVNVAKAFEDTGFADYRIVNERGFIAEELAAVEKIEGVDAASRFLSVNVSRKDDDDIIALTMSENIAVSGFKVTEGAPYDPEDTEGLWICERYAKANGLGVGDTFSMMYKNIEFSGPIRGLIKSGEYLICLVDKTQLMPDFDKTGYVYISPAYMKAKIGMTFFPQIHVRSGLDKDTMIQRAEAALGKSYMVVDKELVTSYAEAHGEMTEGKAMAAVLPVIFLAIAILTMITTMHRISISEKTQIGTLKSLGFKDRRILRHYSAYGLFISLTGTALGIVIGLFIGHFFINPNSVMGDYMDMEYWDLHMPLWSIAVVVLINAVLVLATLYSVASMMKGTAADALRPYAPKAMRRMWIENKKAWKNLSFATKWNIRDILRHKSRSFMTLFGIIGCMLILVASFGMKDALDSYIDDFFEDAINYHTKIVLDTELTDDRAVAELIEKYDADWTADLGVQIGENTYSMEIYGLKHSYYRFVKRGGEHIDLPEDGVLICERIARKEGLKAGDTFTVSVYGTSDKYDLKVINVVQSIPESVMMSDTYADSIGVKYSKSALFTNVADIEESPIISSTQTKQALIDTFNSFTEIMNLMIVLLAVIAVVLGIVVLYNLGVMSYTERYRELSTLKVVGFKDRHISRILIDQNIWMTVLGVALGIPAGIAALQILLVTLGSSYELSLHIRFTTYLLSILLTFGVSFFVGLMVSRKNKKIDMVEALKIPE